MKKLFVLAAAAVFLLLAVGGNAANVSVPCGANLNTYTAAASPGDVLVLGACSYPDQDFRSRVPVTIQGAGIGRSILGDVDAHGAQHITFRDLSLTTTFLVPQNGSSGGVLSGDLHFDRVDMTAGGIFLRGCQDCSFTNGQSGNRHDAFSQTIGAYSVANPSRNILIDNWLFHDQDRRDDPSGHMECLYIQESENVTISNSRFSRCEIFDLYINADVLHGDIVGLKIHNTKFDALVRSGFYAAFQGSASDGVDSEWIGNTFDQGLVFDGGTGHGCGNVTTGSFTFPAALKQPCDDDPPPPPPPPAQCADSVDNDSDGLVDLADPGCVDAADNDEFNEPPPPPPDVCDQACVDEYEARIDALEAQVASLQSDLNAERARSAQLQQKIDNAKAALQ